MMKNKFICSCLLVCAIVSVAMPATANDPLKIRLDNLRDGITRLRSSVEEQRQQIEVLKSDMQNNVSSETVNEKLLQFEGTIAGIEEQIDVELNEIVGITSDLETNVTNLKKDNNQIKVEQSELNNRIAALERALEGVGCEQAIVKRADGSAELFSVNSLGRYQQLLPESSKCRQYANVLTEFANIDVNAIFVKNGANVELCKLEYGMTEWVSFPAILSDRGHVITSDCKVE